MDSMTQIFYEECRTLLASLQDCIERRSEGESYSQETLQEIFRVVHTLKADSAMMLFEELASLSRIYENLLYCFRMYKRNEENTLRFAQCSRDYLEFMLTEVERLPKEGYIPEETAKLEEAFELFAEELSVRKEDEGLPEGNLQQKHQPKRKRQVYYISPGAETQTEESEDKEEEYTNFVLIARKLERVVDEMSDTLERPVKLLVKGEKTKIELSKREKLSSALVHVVRNAVDHGIEDAETREQHGKSPMGMVWLTFSRDSDKVKITVKDDGAGIDYNAVLQNAKQQNRLVKEEEEYTEDEIIHLMLESGVTTTDVPNDYSGRGVGMDVVNCNIRELGGRLDVSSEPGKGTKIQIIL